jgi:hypothetical protein
MPFLSAGISNGGGNLPEDLENSINQILGLLDRSVATLAQENRLTLTQVRLLRPCNFSAIVNDDAVFVVVSNIHPGGIPSRGPDINQTAQVQG